MDKEQYQDYLNSNHWKTVSYCMHKWANGYCTLCHSPSINLHVHHLNYRSLGREEYEDLIVLCSDCHTEVHDGNIKIKKIVYRPHDKIRKVALSYIYMGLSEDEAFRRAANQYKQKHSFEIIYFVDSFSETIRDQIEMHTTARDNNIDYVVAGV